MFQHQPELYLSSLNGSPTTSSTFLNNLPSNSMVLIVGCPGSGKSTLLNQIISLSFQKHFIDLSQETVTEVKARLKHHHPEENNNLCMDNFEQFLFSSVKLSDVEDVLRMAENIPASGRGSVFIASRKSATNVLFRYLDTVHQYVCVEGFTNKGIERYMETFSLSMDILTLKDEYQYLYEMCKTPSICKEFCLLYSGMKANASLTEYVEALILSLVKRELDKSARSHVKNFDTLPLDERNGFKTVCKLAFEVLVRGQKFEDVESSSFFLSSFCLKESLASLRSIKTLDLIDISEHFHNVTDLTKTSFWFISVQVLNFLGGQYLSDLPPLDQVFFLCEHAKDLIDSGYHGWLHYFFGLSTRSGRRFNPTGMMVNSINELLLCCLDLEKSLHSVVFLNSLVETGEKGYWRKLGSRKEKIFDITLSLSEFKHARKGLVSMVEHSGIKEWSLEGTETNLKIAKQIMGILKANVTTSTSRSLVDDIHLRPRTDTSAAVEDRRFKPKLDEFSDIKVVFSYFMCRALREIMQRVLQLFSKVKLKGDSSNPSYLSFLSCSCLEEAMEENVFYMPYIPIHYLPVPGKGKYSLDDNDPTGRHLKEKHNGQAVELVILLQPTLRIMTFILPGSNKQYEITLSSADLPDFLIFEMNYSICDVQDVSCIKSQELSPVKSERVFPGLPIPLNHPELMGGNVVIPETVKVKIRPSVSKKSSEDDEEWEGHVKKDWEGGEEQEEQETKQLEYEKYGIVGTDVEGASDYNTAYKKVERDSPKTWHQEEALGGSGSLVMPFVHSKGLKSGSSSSESGHSFHRHRQPASAAKPLTAMRAGTVSYSIIPERLSADQIHPLPDERSPLQVGGNGIIVRGELKGLRVAIKKTAYRTRELKVMMKLNHPNVLRLLAFMWGDENPKHRRHYFAYHFYDLFHGDLARMVTDNREMVISKLHQTHEYDISFMGRVRGNLIFLLSNILKGLAYLHSLHIAHRDFKASNVLIKFNCSCSNPLMCPCHDKCRVVICDFDAAVQMTDLDELPPANTLGTSRNASSSNVFQNLLVGTTGFRAPECAFEALSNDPAAFTPPVSCRCDIFSFGVFCLRFFVAEDGPRNQKTLAILLLGYHIQKSALRKPKRIDVTVQKVEETLKIPRLRSGMAWLKYSADFVASCLKVDPLERSSASMLLSHPFIRGDSKREILHVASD